MLITLSKEFNERLLKELQNLSEEDKDFFNPHSFNLETIQDLSNELGNYYYIYLDKAGRFIGYGILRTFDKYDIPTLGDVIWQRYRQGGHGLQLVKELLEKARSLGFKKVMLHISPINKIALKMYRKLGFKHINDKLMEIDING